MGVSSGLARLAAGAAVPVLAVVGAGAREAVQDLALSLDVRLVDSPRPANVLLLAGRLPAALEAAASAAHDVMSHPRCTVRWTPDSPPAEGERERDHRGWSRRSSKPTVTCSPARARPGRRFCRMRILPRGGASVRTGRAAAG